MLKKAVSTLFASLFLLGVLGATTACNTMRGMGQDIERGGEKIQGEADKQQR